MRLMFVGCFNWKGTSFLQRKAFQDIDINVISYAYRDKKNLYGSEGRDNDLIETCKREKPDAVLISKGDGINIRVIHELNKITKTGLWYMDSTINYDAALEEKIKYCKHIFVEKLTVIEKAKYIRNDIVHVIEGWSKHANFPRNFKQDIDVSFIGVLYGNRKNLLPENLQIFTNAYNEAHSEMVCRSKINLNFCTFYTASDRVFKVLASKGFLLSDDWDYRETIFKDGHDLVIYKDKNDLEQKIKYYLEHEEERKKIGENGFNTVQPFEKSNWARKIINVLEEKS